MAVQSDLLDYVLGIAMATNCVSVNVKFYAEGESREKLIAFIDEIGKPGSKLEEFSRDSEIAGWVNDFDTVNLEGSSSDWAATFGYPNAIKRLFILLHEAAPEVVFRGAWCYEQTAVGQPWMLYIAGDKDGVHLSDDIELSCPAQDCSSYVWFCMELGSGVIYKSLRCIAEYDYVFPDIKLDMAGVQSVGEAFEWLFDQFSDCDFEEVDECDDEDICTVDLECSITESDLKEVTIKANQVFDSHATIYGGGDNNWFCRGTTDCFKMLAGDVDFSYNFILGIRSEKWRHSGISEPIVRSFTCNNEFNPKGREFIGKAVVEDITDQDEEENDTFWDDEDTDAIWDVEFETKQENKNRFVRVLMSAICFVLFLLALAFVFYLNR